MNEPLLHAQPNPDARHDYLVRIEGKVGGDAQLTLHYVPDRAIAEPAGFAAYLAAFGAAPPEAIEALAARVLEDVNNALVPRWARITVLRADHAVLVEDSQPGWENDALISVLARF